MPGLKVLLPCAGPELQSALEQLVRAHGCQDMVRLLDGQAQQAIAAANVVVLASGTATLETLLLKRPMVICYRLSTLTYALASRMVKVPYVGLPNLLAGRRLVPEYLQHDLSVANVTGAIRRLLAGQDDREGVMAEFDRIHRMLRCNASEQAAAAVLRLCGR